MTRRPPEALSARLRAARLAAGFKTAGDAARALGITPPTYYAHENGTRGVNGPVLVAYARAFSVSLAWLLAGEGEQVEGTGPAPNTSATTQASIAQDNAPKGGPAPLLSPSGSPGAVPVSPRPRRYRQSRFGQPGLEQRQTAPPAVIKLPIALEARRGVFIDPDFKRWHLGEVTVEFPPIDGKPGDRSQPLQPDPRHFFAIRMGDASMDLHYPEGSVVVCRKVSPGQALEGIKQGDHVAVETRLAGIVETVIAEIRSAGALVELHFHSMEGRFRRVEDFEPDRPLQGVSNSPYTQRQRTIVGVVTADVAINLAAGRETVGG